MNSCEMKLVNAEAGEAEISLYDRIGLSADGKSGVTAGAFASAMKKLGHVKTINLRINSRGGDVYDGLGIYEALKNSKAKITAHIDGIAFSMASAVAMAGDEIVMGANSLLMLHDPKMATVGNASDMRDAANLLDKVRDQLAGIYAERTQTDVADIKAMMSRETYLSAPEAKAIRFVTRIAEPKKIAAHLDAEDLAKVPDRFRKLVAELTTPEPEKKPMADTPNPAAPQFTAEELAGLKALLAKPAVENIDADKLVAEAKAAEQKRCSIITDQCKLLGVADFAGGLVAEKITTEEALVKIIAEAAKRNPAAGPNDEQKKKDPPADENTPFREEFKASEKLYAAAGMTVEAFIEQRRIDTGLDQLTTKQPS